MKLHLVRVSVLLTLGLGTLTSQAEPVPTDRSLLVCAEDANWPPYSYQPASPGQPFSGYNQDVLNHILSPLKIPYEVVIRPWKRCLHDTEGGDIDLTLDAAKNPEREEKYLLTNPVYQLTPIFFFVKQRQYDYNNIDHAEQLKSNRTVCGQQGYTYNNFGFDNEEVRMVSKDLPKLIDVVMTHRCDVGLARKEILLTELKNSSFKETLSYRPFPHVSSEAFYYLINRSKPYANELKSILDTGIANMQNSGEAEALLKAYFQ